MTHHDGGRKEAQLIGSILSDEHEDELLESSNIELGSALARSSSAPPQLAVPFSPEPPPLSSGDSAPSSDNREVIDPSDPRLTQEYYTYYYLQRPLDPRLPPPLFNWSSYQYPHAGKEHQTHASTIAPDAEAAPLAKQASPAPAISTTTGTAPDDLSASFQSFSLDDPFEPGAIAPDQAQATRFPTAAFGRGFPGPVGVMPQAHAQAQALALQRQQEQLRQQQIQLQQQQQRLQAQQRQIAADAFYYGNGGGLTLGGYDLYGRQMMGIPAGRGGAGGLGGMSSVTGLNGVPGYGVPFEQQQKMLMGTGAGASRTGGMGGMGAINGMAGYGMPFESGMMSMSIGGLHRPMGSPSMMGMGMGMGSSGAPFYDGSQEQGPGREFGRRGRGGRDRGHKDKDKDRDRGDRSMSNTNGDWKRGGGGGGSTGSTGQAPRSQWLDDFKLSKSSNSLSLKDVLGRGVIMDLATDQHGSRFIQQRLETASADEKQSAFEKLVPETLRLCTDVFGNYVIQKFFEFGTTDQKSILAQKLSGNVVALSLQMYGCRVVQKAIDVSDVETQRLLVRELSGHVMQCVKDQNGNHVIQKCIEKVPSYLIQFIVESFQGQIYHLSTHPYGCRVIQRVLEHCPDSERQNAILAEILENTEELCKNHYGNYVIQHVLVHGSPWHRSAVVQSLRGRVVAFSRHKFASNVVEKAFTHASRPDRSTLIEEVLGKDSDSYTASPLVTMVKDQYANYVVQKMIDVVDEDHRALIVHRIRRHVPNLRKIPYGKHIISRVEKLTGKQIVPL